MLILHHFIGVTVGENKNKLYSAISLVELLFPVTGMPDITCCTGFANFARYTRGIFYPLMNSLLTMQEYIPFIQANLILVVAWVALLVALVVITVKQKTAGYKMLSPAEATLLVNHHNAVLVDVRHKDEFRNGHIAGAVHISAKDIRENNLHQIENDRTNPIIIVCKTGQTAQEAAKHLVKAGFEQVNVLQDGLIAWNEAKLPLVSGKKKK